MAEFRPFRALRYDTAVAGDAATLVAPPFDVVSAEEKQALYDRSPFNVARIDYGEERAGDNDGENRYRRAQKELAAWREQGVLKLDPEPRFYVYDQEFELRGRKQRRRAVFGRLRLEEWEKRIIIPHEHTRARDKADRLSLLQATGVNLSPILALYSLAVAALSDDAIEEPLFDATLVGDHHTLRPLCQEAAPPLQEALADQRLYIADGHHRYETALAYRDERRATASRWTGAEAENFVLAALVDVHDPGLVVLPTHRLLRSARVLDLAQAARLFDIRTIEGGGTTALATLRAELAATGHEGTAFGVISQRGELLQLLSVRDKRHVGAMLPADRPRAWRTLDVAILHHALLPALGFEEATDTIDFTEDEAEALAQVERGIWDHAFLLNPTRVNQVIAVGEAGERMPQKSTFFYPKLGTGVVLLPLQ